MIADHDPRDHHLPAPGRTAPCADAARLVLRLLAERRAAGMTQRTAIDRIGGAPELWLYENGRSAPSVAVLARWGRLFGLKLVWAPLDAPEDDGGDDA